MIDKDMEFRIIFYFEYTFNTETDIWYYFSNKKF